MVGNITLLLKAGKMMYINVQNPHACTLAVAEQCYLLFCFVFAWHLPNCVCGCYRLSC